MFRLLPLSEASIEGYHAEVQRIVNRGFASTAPWVFSNLRLQSNLERLQSWCARPAGLSIVSFEWSRHKRILQPPTEQACQDVQLPGGPRQPSTVRNCGPGCGERASQPASSLEGQLGIGRPWGSLADPWAQGPYVTFQIASRGCLLELLSPGHISGGLVAVVSVFVWHGNGRLPCGGCGGSAGAWFCTVAAALKGF